ncbi:NAD+ synthase [bacterium]|nr:NAD+ synthase [bacterium]
MRITLAQLNPTIGDFCGNIKKMHEAMLRATSDNSEMIIFPELFPSGYPPKDLLEKPVFIKRYEQADKNISKLSVSFPELFICYGTIEKTDKTSGKLLYNTARIIKNGKLVFTQRKSLLPTYDVFDEARYFLEADEINLFTIKGEQWGISICEDAWNASEIFDDRLYDIDPVENLGNAGAQYLLNISASPFTLGKAAIRIQLAQSHARRHGIPFILVNQVGANDELISDGRSFIVDGKGRIRVSLPAFKESVITVDLDNLPDPVDDVESERTGTAYDALVLGISDYMSKCGFKSVVLGLSGGVDSALTCCLAAAALGPQNVHAVYMPSPYSADASGEDARTLANNLSVHYDEIPISDTFDAYKIMMRPWFKDTEEDVAEENFQARIRGNILMGLSNKFGYLCLSSGNKSELSVGYCTLYGDMSGGLAVLADVPKTLVYQICNYINRDGNVIPQRILTRPPTAELRPDQTDQDTLPPYDILDSVLDLYLEQHLGVEEIIDKGYDKETVEWIIKTVIRNEYKRIQAAPGLKITSKAFGSGRRMPIAAKYS